MKRPARLSLPAIALERSGPTPLHAQLYDQLRGAMARGSLPSRLPSTRALAAQLQVSRNTVLSAYEALRMEGLLEARTGSGTWRKAVAKLVLNRADLVRGSHFPFGEKSFYDPDGNALRIHR